MQASKLLFAGLVVVAGLAPTLPASAAAMTNSMAMKPTTHAIALGCSAGKGDVSQTITITNTTKSTLPKGTKISWVLNKAKGVKVLPAKLAAGKTVEELGPPGNGGSCQASYMSK